MGDRKGVPEHDYRHPPPPRNATPSSSGARRKRMEIKKRASKACQGCRTRKVKCDVVDHGNPCSNCQLDEMSCIVIKCKRGKKPSGYNARPLTSVGHQLQIPVLKSTHAETIATASFGHFEITKSSSSGILDSDGSVDDTDAGPILESHVRLASDGQSSHSWKGFEPTPDVLTAPFLDSTNLLTSMTSLGDVAAVSTQLRSPLAQSIDDEVFPLPNYIKPLPQRIRPDAIQYLRSRGGLSLPGTHLRNELIRCYIDYVHPYMPLLDLHEFFCAIDQKPGENSKVSLLLFQAVMFASVAFVDMTLLRDNGYTSLKGARKTFYDKTRLLYDFDVEVDRLVVVQSLLLMTYWCERPEGHKDIWHWMGVAISLAHTIGLNRNPERSNMEVRRRRLWKRIWWSCFIRDHMIALGISRPMRIKAEDYDVPMLTLEDFEIESLAFENGIAVSRSYPPSGTTATQIKLATLCIAKARLCQCIGHILSAHYVTLGAVSPGKDGNTLSTVMLFPKRLEQTDELQLCDRELVEWFQSLPTCCLYRKLTPGNFDHSESSVIVQRALLHMVFLASVSALHRPYMLKSPETDSLRLWGMQQDISRKKVHEAARDIAKISFDLHNQNLDHYLPTSGVAMLFPAIVIQLLNLKSRSDTVRVEALEMFGHCMQVVEKLQESYAIADYTSQLVMGVVKKADIDIVVEFTLEKGRVRALWKFPEPRTQAAAEIPHDDVIRSVKRAKPTLLLEVKEPGDFLFTPCSMGSDVNAEIDDLRLDSHSQTSTLCSILGEDCQMRRTHQEDMNVNRIELHDFFASLDNIHAIDWMDSNWWTALDNGLHGEDGSCFPEPDWTK